MLEIFVFGLRDISLMYIRKVPNNSVLNSCLIADSKSFDTALK